MASSGTANVDELERLWHRLDKALPRALEEEEEEPMLVGGSAMRPGRTAHGSKATALRTIVLAGSVSLLVSLGVVTLLLNDTPVRRFLAALAPAKDGIRPAPARKGRSVAGGERPLALVGETAAIQAEVAPQPPTPSSVEQEPLRDAAASTASTSSSALSAAEPEQSPASVPQKAPVLAAPPPIAPAAPEKASEEPSRPSLAAVSAPADEEPDSSGQSAALDELDATQFLQRGLAMLSRGGVSAARLLLERAADLGNGEAAFALATTYDGAPGAPRQGREVQPNVELALRWYARARELGIEAARRRLAELKDGAATSSR